jgi:ribosomal protein S12 methylthiotransferase
MAHQQEISRARLARWVGREIEVLVDAAGPEGSLARSAADAPEIDGAVHVPGVALPVGEFARVRVVASDEHDLEAEPVG